MKAYRLAIVCVLLMPLLAWPGPAQAAAEARCFPETGYCISGLFRAHWERNGGLEIFGFPISAPRVETVEGSWTGTVQWFERDRLEDHSAEGLGVLGGRLGARYLELQGRAWQTYYPAEEPRADGACRYFPQTRHNLCGTFLRFWEDNGGLARFGYPISSEDGVQEGPRQIRIVQYFERRRIERHAELAGTPYEVLLGLLGSEVYRIESLPACPEFPADVRPTWERYARDLGCGAFYLGREWTQLAWQPFVWGAMYWVPGPEGEPGNIFAVISNRRDGYTWQWYADTYREGEPISYPSEPPPGTFPPIRGFGKVWSTNPELREALGWATLPEQADSGRVLQFPGPGGFSWIIYRANANMVGILRAGGPAIDTVRIP